MRINEVRRHLVRVAIIAGALSLMAIDAGACDHSPELAARRAAFNEALAKKNIDGVRDALAPGVVLVTGSGSMAIVGSAAQEALWSDTFKSGENRLYVRTPECVTVSEILPIAHENGQWRGEWRERQADGSSGPASAHGVYSAKWRKIDGAWKIEAEVFTTTACSGAAECRR